MKIHGLEVTPPEVKTLVFPGRLAGGKDLVLKFQPILDLNEFDKIYPIPEPPTMLFPDGSKKIDIDDEDYVKARNNWFRNKTNWLMLKSLSATEGLEWSSIDMKDINTFGNLRTELEGLFSQLEISMIFEMQNKVCCLDRDSIEEATQSFLRRLESEPKLLDSLLDDLQNTPIGEPAKD